ncbi:MAG: hypothetical protein HKN47_25400 [Pirellulaceae bacterium]|nr:hypothetical protein [Pirellulaceae bacterium]
MDSSSAGDSNDHASSSGNALSDADRDRSLQYLLGELSPGESATFEKQLAQSSALSDVFVQQSEIVCQLSAIDLADSYPAIQSAHNSSLPGSATARWSRVLVALAACLLLAYIGFALLPSEPSQTTAVLPPVSIEEDLLIARAWADTNAYVEPSALDLEVESELNVLSDDELEGSSLSWVISAIETGGSIDG